MMDATSRALRPASPPARPAAAESPKRKTLFDRILLAFFLLFLGALSTLAISWALAFKTELDNDPSLTGQGVDGPRSWVVQGWSGFGSVRIHSTRNVPSWSVLQAVGPPDTPGAGDIVTAWASASTDSQKEWLIFEYEKPVTPTQIDVHETYNPGALERVSVFSDGGEEVTVWQGKDPTAPGSSRGVSSVPVSVNFKTSRVKIYLDSPRVQGWNEIDTVGLADDAGNTLWPINASASSSYGGTPSAPGTTGPESFLPEWCPLIRPGPDIVQHKANHEDRMIEARGWPLIAMWGERELNPPASMTTTPRSGARLTGFGFGGGAAAPMPLRAASASVFTPLLPINPIWRNFIINSIILAIVFRLIYLTLAVPRRFVLELSRMRRGCCLRCGYQLGFDFRSGCPECGWRRSINDHHPE
ncbi:MAG TPA: hypothetical protein VGP99_13295 [Tepidisphaeraceae bacterium]|jgi:hypothetical protein|nr:hypothetical protein [Tepidisphaeraceae bacterium]